MPEEYAIHLGRAVPDNGGPPRWIGRTYDADGNHVHSTEGGAELTTCVTEALRAIQGDLEMLDEVRSEPTEAGPDVVTVTVSRSGALKLQAAASHVGNELADSDEALAAIRAALSEPTDIGDRGEGERAFSVALNEAMRDALGELLADEMAIDEAGGQCIIEIDSEGRFFASRYQLHRDGEWTPKSATPQQEDLQGQVTRD